MMEKVFLGKRIAVSLLLAILAGVSGPTFAAEVRDIRVATTETGTRGVLDLSAPAFQDPHSGFRAGAGEEGQMHSEAVVRPGLRPGVRQ